MRKEKIFEFFKILKNKEGMVVGYILNSSELKLFLDGFIWGLNYNNFHFDVKKWLEIKHNKSINMSWSNFIFFISREKSDEELKLILIETLEDFFKENPDWDKK